jgi:hypothetical protein
VSVIENINCYIIYSFFLIKQNETTNKKVSQSLPAIRENRKKAIHGILMFNIKIY